MLKKYENFIKLSKSKQCSFYEANIRNDMTNALLKRLKSDWSWNQILKSHALKLESRQTFSPKILQIFKHKGSYFVVYERPNGSSLKFSNESLKLEVEDFYSVFHELVDQVSKLKHQVQNLYIYSEWMFFNRNSIKICHFEPYFQLKNNKIGHQNHVFIYDVLKGNYNSQKIAENQQQKVKRIRNLNFNLGYIAYHLLTGRVTQIQEDQSDYELKIKEILQNSQARILKESNDKTLASLVVKLLNCNDDQITFEEVTYNNDLFDELKCYLNRKKIQCRSCKVNRESFRVVEFSLEKMKLQKKQSKIKMQKKKKCVRPCCHKTFEAQPNPESDQRDKNRYQIVERKQSNQKIALSKPIKLRTQLSQSSSQNKLDERTFSNLRTVNRQRINASSVLPSMGTQRQNSSMLTKTKNFRTRELMFKKSMEVNQTAKSYLKTEY